MHVRMNMLYTAVADNALPVKLQGHEGKWVSANAEIRSEVGSLVAEQCGTFGAVIYVLNSTTVKVSLRGSSTFDVLPLAKKLGGGGHPKSASFSIPIENLPAFMAGEL